MEWHRVKNIILAILVIVNGMLLLLVWNQRAETLRYEQSALNGVIQVLAENGIELSLQTVENRKSCQSGSAERDLEAEAELAAVLLGEAVQRENLGGGLYTYRTHSGELSFRPGGVLTAELADVPAWHTTDPESHAAVLMGSLGIECSHVHSDLVSGSGTILYVQMVEDAPVFSGQMVLTYEGGRLCSISGTLLAMTEPEMENETLLSLPTVLLRFLDDVLANGDVCSAILKVEPGYLVTQSFSNAIQLRPIWYISTNTADYYVDGITGELTRAATV